MGKTGRKAKAGNDRNEMTGEGLLSENYLKEMTAREGAGMSYRND